MHLLFIITIIFAVIFILSVVSVLVNTIRGGSKRFLIGAGASAAVSFCIMVGCGFGGMVEQEKLDKPKNDAFKAEQKAKAEANAADKLEKANNEAKKK